MLLRDVIGTFTGEEDINLPLPPTLRWGVMLGDRFHVTDCMPTCDHSHDLYMRGGDCPGSLSPEANPTCARYALYGAHAPPTWGVTI